jgi:hypothetical protein
MENTKRDGVKHAFLAIPSKLLALLAAKEAIWNTFHKRSSLLAYVIDNNITATLTVSK